MFYDDLAVGKAGEQMVYSALAAKGHKIQDLSSCREYQEKDIDMLITNKRGETAYIEIKSDMRSNYTGNIFIECYNNNNVSRNGKGWFFYCEADFLCFVQETKHVAHIVSREELIRKCNSGAYRTANSPFSRGYIIPIQQLQQYESYYCLNLG